ncbi:hypothetical protein C8J57DRAFT_1473666 [Mycena rebaudengoi]|nr:hypothetical protein C8J57DRAFT_1473666 [Mycena rebaudengoi]
MGKARDLRGVGGSTSAVNQGKVGIETASPTQQVFATLEFTGGREWDGGREKQEAAALARQPSVKVTRSEYPVIGQAEFERLRKIHLFHHLQATQRSPFIVIARILSEVARLSERATQSTALPAIDRSTAKCYRCGIIGHITPDHDKPGFNPQKPNSINTHAMIMRTTTSRVAGSPVVPNHRTLTLQITRILNQNPTTSLLQPPPKRSSPRMIGY